MAAKHRGYKAWLVRWEWAGGHAAVERPVIAVLPPQTGEDDVRRFVERHYMATQYDETEMLLYMRRPRTNPYRARFGTTPVLLEDGSRSSVTYRGEILCGHNPYVVATLVDDLRRDDGQDSKLVWTVRPKPILDLRSDQCADDNDLTATP